MCQVQIPGTCARFIKIPSKPGVLMEFGRLVDNIPVTYSITLNILKGIPLRQQNLDGSSKNLAKFVCRRVRTKTGAARLCSRCTAKKGCANST